MITDESSPQHVYEIAHGKPLRSYDDRVIYYALADANVIS